ncbi:MAG TPA: histidine phosphatase family protein [Jatrophihabitans sp.]|jgi:phosphohistidine phosphatase|nr:histidine phosphatase family protein [Jatrophihabitans sp.]
MARTLVLIRHAKATDAAVDIDRPLASRGIRDARAIGKWLTDAEITPERVVLSPARRARQTWEGAAAQLAIAPVAHVDDRIYDNEVAALLDVVRETPAQINTLVLVGHNPSFSDLAYALDDGNAEPEAMQDLLTGFPTSAVAVYDVASAWDNVSEHGARLTGFAAPRG